MTEGSLSTSARGAPPATAIDADSENQAFEWRLLAAYRRRQRRQRALQIGLGAGVPLLGFVIWQSAILGVGKVPYTSGENPE